MHIDAPFELVLFGGLGDLAQRKLLPALYLLHRDGRLPAGRIYSTTRREISPEAFTDRVRTALRQYVAAEFLEESSWQSFSERLHCLTVDLSDDTQYELLASGLMAGDINRIFYLATGSDLYTNIARGLHNSATDISNKRKKYNRKKEVQQKEIAQKKSNRTAGKERVQQNCHTPEMTLIT